MRPGTVHIVLSGEHCFTYGGHFYCAATMEQTLFALLAEHHLGFQLTNTHHSDAATLLFRLLEKYAALSESQTREFMDGKLFFCQVNSALF